MLNHDPTLGAAPGRPSVLMLWDVAGTTGLLVVGGRRASTCWRTSPKWSGIARGHGGQFRRAKGGRRSGRSVRIGPRCSRCHHRSQRAIARQSWPDDELVAVRSAIHIGDVTVTAAGVFGSEVHRCARLRALADGGEVSCPTPPSGARDSRCPTVRPLSTRASSLTGRRTETEHLWRLVTRIASRQRAVQRAARPPHLFRVANLVCGTLGRRGVRRGDSMPGAW